MGWVNYSAVQNSNWQILQTDDGKFDKTSVMHALLMDIRRELQLMNHVLQCSNTARIPFVLDAIPENTKRPKREKAARKER